MNFCSNCGAKVGAEAFCGECGSIVDSSPTPATKSAAASSSAQLVTHAAPGASGAAVAHAVPGEDVVSEHARRMRTLFVCSSAMAEGPRGAELLAGLRRRTALGDVLIVGSDALAQTQERLRGLGVDGRASGVDAVCLVGSDVTLPHARVEDRTGRGGEVLTDNYFGRADSPNDDERMAGELLPAVPVSRLPFDDAETIIALLRRPDVLSSTWNNGVLVSCEVWRGASAAVVEHLGAVERLHLAPPSTDDHVGGLLVAAPPGRLYFNVHGTDLEPVWVGQGHDGNHPEVLRPAMIRVAPGAVVVSEACFGAACYEDEEAIGQAFLARGASAFFGSTIIAWGPPQAPPGLADLIPIHVYQQLDAGRSAAEALQAAKRAIRDDYLERDDGLCAQVENTLLSFCHYGLPWCRSTTRPQPGRKPPGVPNGVKAVATRSSAPSLLSSLRGGSNGVLGRMRAGLADKAARQGWGVEAFVTGPLEDIAATLGPLAHLLDRVRAQSGSSKGTGVLTRYRSRLGERITVTVEDAGAGAVIRGLIADEKGAVLEEFVSRQIDRWKPERHR